MAEVIEIPRNKNFYLNNTKKYLRNFDKFIVQSKKIIKKNCTGTDFKQIKTRLFDRYQFILNDLPYIGGDDNNCTGFLLQGAQGMAIIDIFTELGLPKEQIGDLIYRMTEESFRKMNPIKKAIAKKVFVSKKRIEKLIEAGNVSQKKEYPENWVYQAGWGNGKDLVYTNTYYECGICKFFKSRGYDDYIPYLCKTDYAVFDAFGLELRRTKTIGAGDDICNFKIYKKQQPKS